MLGNEKFLVQTAWPVPLEALLSSDIVKLPVQVNGKLRAVIELNTNELSEDNVKSAVAANDKIQRIMEGKSIKKFIYVPNRIVNIVI